VLSNRFLFNLPLLSSRELAARAEDARLADRVARQGNRVSGVFGFLGGPGGLGGGLL
jgi:hypothetical protein